jgi:NADP-dependent aldehyde dehydrogenase
VFAEMGSSNCVFIWPAAFAKDGPKIADELAASVLGRVGQQCTKPGMVFVAGNNEHWTLYKMMCERLLASTPRRLLARTIADNYYHRLDQVASSWGILECTRLPTPDQRNSMLGLPVVIAACDTAMEDAPEVWEEIFGPAIIVGRTFGTAQFHMRGALTATIYAEPGDIDGSFEHPDGGHWGEFVDWFRYIHARAGRIIFNGPPTGVRVAPGIVHGGPFPASNRPDTTAVGPRAIERWCRPVCWQNAPAALLPEPLRG